MYKNYTRIAGGMAVPKRIHKLLLIMRLTIIILTAMIFQVQAATFGQSVTLHLRNVPLSEVINEIRTQTGYDFFYNNALIKQAAPVTLDVTDANIEDVLALCFRGQPFDYRIDNKVVMIREKEPEMINVRGHVTDSTGAPLPGAAVHLQDSNVGVVTDANGDFRMNDVEEGSVLQISFIGFTRYDVVVTRENAQNIAVVLKEDSRLLQELVVFSNGYQTLSRERSAGAFAQADMGVISERSTTMNILARLDGQIPGLSVNTPYYSANNTGRDNFLVRGATSIGAPLNNGGFQGTSRTPLFVVDGVVVTDVSFINPQDVKDVTVLKDATAASIWGSRAANGVVVITTKKGAYNSRLRVNYDGFINFQGRPDFDFYPVMSSQEYMATFRELSADPAYQTANPWKTYADSKSLGTAPYPHEQLLYDHLRGRITEAQMNAGYDSLARYTNHKQISDLFYRNAVLMNHTVSLSGGSSKHSFYGSVAYTDTKSPLPGETNKSYKINLRQDFKINDALQFFLITDLTQQKSSAKRNSAIWRDNSSPYTYFNPYQLFQDGQGNNLSVPYYYLLDSTRAVYESKSRISLDYNPLDELSRGYTDTDGLNARINGGGTVRIFKGLRFEGTYNYVKGTTKTIGFDKQESFAVRNEVVAFTLPAATATANPTYLLPEKGGRYSVFTNDVRNWSVRNQLVLDTKWGVHQLTALAGQEAQDMLTLNHNSRVRGYDETLQIFVPTDYSTLSKGVTGTVMPNISGVISQLAVDNFSSSETESRFTSYYANAGYTYNRKYSLNASWRIDQSTLFGKDKSAQNKPVWSAGVKWIMSQEEFMRNLSWIESLALRFTYGITGNSPVSGTAASNDIVTATGNNFFPGGKGLGIVTTGNPKLTWESTRTTNFGLDFTVLHGRIDVTLDVYRKYTENLLGLVPTNSLTGYPNVIGNLGDMTNRGVEAAIHSVNIQQGNFRWGSSFIFSYNKNEVVEHARYTPITTAAQLIPSNGAAQFLEDYPSFALFAYAFAGLDNQGDPQIRLHDGTVTKTPNTAMKDDARYMGTIQPPWSGGFSNTLRYKNFQLSAHAIFNMGHVMRRSAPQQLLYFGPLRNNLPKEFLDRWKTEGDEAHTNIPSYEPIVSESMLRRSLEYYTLGDINVVSASYIKFRDITLTYYLPESLTRKIRAEGVSFRAQLSNVMLWTANNDDLDPEFQNGVIPMNQKTITFGAHITL